jgi:hypothetical protein
MLPKLTTLRPNLTRVDMKCGTLWFSYQTLVAFQTERSGLMVRKNEWGPTTGKHLNEIDGKRDYDRIDLEQFAKLFWTHLG